jgi:arabinofuranosyltransferase
MSGRFLAVPLFLAVIIISRLELSGFVSLLLILLAMDVSLLSPHCPVLSTADYGNQGITREDIVRNNGISDERAYYYQELGFLKSNSSPVPHNYVWPEDKNRQETKASAVVIGYGVIGHSALDQAPTTHIIDRYALVDPLLARLPMSPGSEWRIGHFARKIPKGYTETLRSGRNKIADKDIALYYDKLSLLTRGNLFAPQRLMTMVKMNLGYYDHLVKGSYLTEIPPVTVTIPSPENYLELSFEYMRNKQFKEGIAVAEQALKLRPNYAEAYNNLGLAYIYLGRWREGIKALNKALALKPDFELARNNLKWAKSKIRQNPK